jgi:hypothetical protein
MDSCHFPANIRARARGGLFKDSNATFRKVLVRGFVERFSDAGSDHADK